MPKIGDRFNPHRIFSGIFIPDAVYRHPRLSSTAKLIYGRLCRYKGESGEAYPAVTTLAEEIGASERQTFDHLSRLVDEGFIAREPRPGTSTVYHFLWHECFEENGEGVVRKTALPEKSEWCGNPQGGSAEIRTGGSAENRSIRESIEESQLRELTSVGFFSDSTAKPKPEDTALSADLQLDESFEKFAKDAGSRHRPRVKVKFTENQWEMRTNLRDMDAANPVIFRRAYLNYLDEREKYVVDKGWPMWKFEKEWDRWDRSEFTPPPTSAEFATKAQPGRIGDDPPVVLDPGIAQSAPEVAKNVNPPITPRSLIERWNARFPEYAWEWHASYSKHATMNDPAFMEKFDAIMDHAEMYFALPEEERGWFDFGWVIGSKNHMPNWVPWLQRPPFKRKPATPAKSAGESVADRLIARLEAQSASEEKK
jgi:hypothetical protein